MSIFRTPKSPFWQYDFRLDGYRFTGSTKCRNEDDATRFEAARKIDAQVSVDKLRADGASPLTIKAACDRWWHEHGRTLADARIESVLDRLVELLGAKTYLHDINDDMVSRLVEARSKDVRRDSIQDGKQLYRPITPSTVNRTLDLLRRIVRRARDNWMATIVREPTWKRHRLKEKRQHVRELTAAEESTLDQIEDIDFAELRRFAIITGLRRKDLLITWPQVDLDLGIVRVITKGGVPRVIPLSREAYAILWRRRDHHPLYCFTFKASRTFKSHPKNGEQRIRGQRYPITYFGIGSNKRKWKKAGVDAKFHALRHTTGMRTLRKTGNLRVVQKILGHSDIAITAKFYTDANVEDMRAAMEATAPRELDGGGPPKLIEQKKD